MRVVADRAALNVVGDDFGAQQIGSACAGRVGAMAESTRRTELGVSTLDLSIGRGRRTTLFFERLRRIGCGSRSGGSRRLLLLLRPVNGGRCDNSGCERNSCEQRDE